jgi:hypothetical protein
MQVFLVRAHHILTTVVEAEFTYLRDALAAPTGMWARTS